MTAAFSSSLFKVLAFEDADRQFTGCWNVTQGEANVSKILKCEIDKIQLKYFNIMAVLKN